MDQNMLSLTDIIKTIKKTNQLINVFITMQMKHNYNESY